MNRLVRMLVMFAPMIIRQFQKWQRSREKAQHTQQIPPQQEQDAPRSNRDGREYEYKETPQPPRQPKDSELV